MLCSPSARGAGSVLRCWWAEPVARSRQAASSWGGKGMAHRPAGPDLLARPSAERHTPLRFGASWAFALMVLAAAAQAIMRNKLRAVLTMLGVFIGVAALIAMVAVGQGANAAVEKEIENLGTNLLVVLPGATTSNGVRGGHGSASTLTVDDARTSLSLALYALAAARVMRRPCRRVELHHLPTGRVLAWDRMSSGNPDPQVWDPLTSSITAVPLPDGANLFCAASLTLRQNGDNLTGDWIRGEQTGTVEIKKVVAEASVDMISGEWEAVADAQGQPFPFTLVIKLEGDKVTGSSSSQLGNVQISTGAWKDGKLSILLDGGGGQIALVATMIDGKLAGDYDFAGQASGKWVAMKKK